MARKSIIFNAHTALFLPLAVSYNAVASEYIVPPMVNIPAGEFVMGTTGGEKQAQPAHKVSLSALSIHATTLLMLKACAARNIKAVGVGINTVSATVITSR